MDARDLILHWLFPLFTGACVGSFLNVCIYRIPLGRSVVRPGSHCAACGAPIPWWRNLPVLSWFILRGRAACCGTRIDFRYALVEALTAALFVTLWQRYAVLPWLAAIYLLFVCGLIVATFVDLDHFIIPDRITLGGGVLGVLLSALYPQLHHTHLMWQGLWLGLAGLAAGGGLLLVIALAGSVIFRQPPPLGRADSLRAVSGAGGAAVAAGR
jgi:leader peptidase (prepilin peptidase)/N-methyltransferase